MEKEGDMVGKRAWAIRRNGWVKREGVGRRNGGEKGKV